MGAGGDPPSRGAGREIRACGTCARESGCAESEGRSGADKRKHGWGQVRTATATIVLDWICRVRLVVGQLGLMLSGGSPEMLPSKGTVVRAII